MRYELHYFTANHPCKWMDNWKPFGEQIMEFKTLKEAQAYLEIAGDKAYIFDKVTNKKITN